MSLSLSSIRVSLALRKCLINVGAEVEMHFEVPSYQSQEKGGTNKSCKVTEKGGTRQTDENLLLLLPTSPQSNNCNLHASLFRTPISLAVGGVVRKRRKLL